MELVVGGPGQRVQVSNIGGVGQRIHVDEMVLGSAQNRLEEEVRANETSASRNQEPHRALELSRPIQRRQSVVEFANL